MQSEKKKLTLSINSEVIEKAKKLGLNLSEITEKALKISSLSPDDNIVTPDKLREVYIDVLKKISEILKKWNARLEIGSQDDLAVYTDSLGKKSYHNTNSKYILSPYLVELWSENNPSDEPDIIWFFDDEKLPVTRFYNPEKIIINLVDTLYNKANKNKEVLDKLQVLKNILELSGLSK
ncbi:MAG: type II toxin-antitoxin system CcdA family antitoxin [Candidatus Methanoperedens sp.]|nr:type II toxin-antitoxin system CcdA family antitoxin [Candidatus Methanoperedens sp.]